LLSPHQKGEQTIAFCTEADAIRYLHRTLLEACGGGWLNGYVGLRVPRVEADHRAGSIVWVRETPYQKDHNQFGATWAVRREWATYTLGFPKWPDFQRLRRFATAKNACDQDGDAF
jgi:hypothetical protein